MKKIEYESVIRNLIVNSRTNTQIIELKYTSKNPQQSYNLIYSMTEKLMAYSKELNPITSTQILEIKYKSKDSKEAKEVLKNVTDEFMSTTKKINVKVIEEVELLKGSVIPNKIVNIAIAFLLGFMVSGGLVFLLEYLDNTYKNKE